MQLMQNSGDDAALAWSNFIGMMQHHPIHKLAVNWLISWRKPYI
jgi:hypothetical protein